jgi:hypothetical protein
MKIAGSGSASGSISQRHGSADPDPDPHQNVMDPQHWLAPYLEILVEGEGCLASKALQWLADSVESAIDIRTYSAKQMYRESA